MNDMAVLLSSPSPLATVTAEASAAIEEELNDGFVLVALVMTASLLSSMFFRSNRFGVSNVVSAPSSLS